MNKKNVFETFENFRVVVKKKKSLSIHKTHGRRLFQFEPDLFNIKEGTRPNPLKYSIYFVCVFFFSSFLFALGNYFYFHENSEMVSGKRAIEKLNSCIIYIFWRKIHFDLPLVRCRRRHRHCRRGAHFAWPTKWSEANTHINFVQKLDFWEHYFSSGETFQSHIFCRIFHTYGKPLADGSMQKHTHTRQREIQVDSILFK